MGVLRYLLAGCGTAAAVATHHTTALLVLAVAYVLVLVLAGWTACRATDVGNRADALRLVLLLIPRRAEELRILAPLLTDRTANVEPRPDANQRPEVPAGEETVTEIQDS
jgi:hypothetical protein